MPHPSAAMGEHLIPITRPRLLQGFAFGAAGLLLPMTLAENAEAARRFWALDQTMVSAQRADLIAVPGPEWWRFGRVVRGNRRVVQFLVGDAVPPLQVGDKIRFGDLQPDRSWNTSNSHDSVVVMVEGKLVTVMRPSAYPIEPAVA